MKKTCINPNSIQVKELSDELGLKPIIVAAKIAVWQDKNNTYEFPSANDLVEGVSSKQKESLGDFLKELSKLPKPIVDSIKLVENVPIEIIDNSTIYYAMKDVFESNGITDPLLINWAGLHKHIIGHPKNIKSEKELRLLVLQSLNKKLDKRKYKEEFKINKLAEESFDNWVKALDDFPLEFQDIMLAHAIKHIINPERKSKYVLQLSSVALTNTYGIMMNKPNEMNRLGKLYDQEVIKNTSDAVEHEKSASGKGYWVHIAKSKQDSEVYNTNIELLRKLSPSTWCTASSLTAHYVENYDNYLLIVDGVTVVGIEAGELGNNGKIQVKEVTSRNNNGIASINHLDDTIAFFEKHNLDLDNHTIKSAIKAKDDNKTDEDVTENTMDFYDFEIDYREEMMAIDRFNVEYDYEPDWDLEERIANDYMESYNIMSNIKNKDEITDNIIFHLYSAFNALPENLRNDFDIATRAIQGNPDNIAHINRDNESYRELALIAINKDYRTYGYLSPAMKNDGEIKQIYDDATALNGIELPFSKSNNLIQGYYNPKTDEVVVVTSNTPIKEISKVAIHEVAHRGMLRMAKDLGGFEQLYNVLTSAEKQLMEKMPELLKRTGHKSLDSLLLDYGFNKNTKEGKFKLLQELAARWAETLVDKPKPSWWKELLQEIGKWIKKFTNKTLNEQEVNELVGGFVKYGTKEKLNSNDKTTQGKTEITIGNKKYKQGTYTFKEIFDNIGEKSVSEGVDFVFEQNPELEKIGSKKQYSEYLDTIFPNSKVKDILYHGTNNKFDKFDLKYQGSNPKGGEGVGFNFTRDLSETDLYGDIKMSVLLNGVNKVITDEEARVKKESYIDDIDEIVVYDSNQIHILGNKQDIEGFKKYIKSYKQTDKNYANKLLKMLYGLSNQNIDNMKVEIVDNIVEAGHFDNGIIRLNINSLNPETVFTHEVIHALTALKLAYWKKNSPKVYKDMEKVWIDSKAILDPLNERYEFSNLDEFYAALSKQSFVEELASVKDDSFIGKLIQLFKDMLSKLGIKVEGTLAERALNNLTNIVKSEIGSNKRIETILKGISSRKYDKVEIDESEDYHFGYYKGWYYSYNEENDTYEKYKDSETIPILKEEYYKDLDDYRKDNSAPKSLAKLAQSLLNLPLDNTLKVRYAKHLEGAFGNFVLDENTINIASSTNKSRVFLHEYIHSLTHSILKTYISSDTFFENDNYSKEELEKMYEDDTWRDYFSLSKDRKIQKFVDKIHELYYYAVNNANDTNYYGFTNLDEFIAEAFTNKDFQLELATIPYKNDNIFSNLFNEFISAINKLLGIPIENSVLSEIISTTDELLSSKLPILKSEGGQKVYYQNNSGQSNQDYIASEKTIRDLAARLANRIGIEVKFISDRSKDFKGKLEGNVATINLAYATLSTPIHEILGHPIVNQLIKSKPELYNNLLKELESGKGLEVLDRIKRDYDIKNIDDVFQIPIYNYRDSNSGIVFDEKIGDTHWKIEYDYNDNKFYISENGYMSNENTFKDFIKNINSQSIFKYTLEEQQEEAIVELLGLMTAEKLDAVKDGKLISLLKRLLKEMATFMRNLLRQKEIEVDKLPDNMTLNDLADLLAYSNSKIILPGNEVIYTTPDNQTFKTYQEASNHIAEMSKNVKDVDLDNIKLNETKKTFAIPEIFGYDFGQFSYVIKKINNQWIRYSEHLAMEGYENEEFISEKTAMEDYNTHVLNDRISITNFIEKNKEYEQSKEIIEEWKKVNGIKYNPEEIYSRGQGFYSVVGAYSQFDVKLMFQNLLHHIEDNKKAGGHFVISAFTKPIDKNISHLEGGGGKIKFVIYPKSEDILWATNRDAYSGSVWDAAEKVNKDKKSELLGVSYTKYPSLTNINSVQPNLASIVDNLADHHNELGIVLSNNFRLEVDEDVSYEIKRLVGVINSVLDDTYGKIKKPTIESLNKVKKYKIVDKALDDVIKIFDTKEEALAYFDDDFTKAHIYKIVAVNISEGIQPTITEKDLKESIDTIKDNVLKDTYIEVQGWGNVVNDKSNNKKQYNQQALINTKIAALKEVAKKYPRSLIRSEVINNNNFNTYYQKSGTEGGQEMQGKLSKDNVQVGDLIVNNSVGLRVTALNENDLTTEDGQTIPYDADFNVFRTAPNEISENKSIEDVPFNEHESELSENKPIEDLAMEEADNYIPLNPTEVEVATFDWVSKIVTSYEEMGKELSNVSRNNSGKTLYNDNVTHASKIRNINKEHATESELLKTIKQAASIVMYVSNLKYNLISKGEVSTDKSAYTNVLNSPLLGLAKKIAADYKGDTSEWTDEQHKKYTEMASYIRTYLDIHTNQSEIANLKIIMKQSRNQTDDINAYLKSIGQSSDYNSAAQDIQEVIDAMEEINLTLKYSTHFANTLMINNKKEIAAKIASNNEIIEKKNNKILSQIALNEEKIVKNPEKKEKLEEENDELRKGLKEIKDISSVQQIQNELMNGNDNGFLKAVTGSIHDLGDASMSLLANRVEENFQKMQNRFAPMGKEMTDAWTDFSEDLGAVYDDEKVMKNFTEIIEYTDREGIERTEKHFISERDMKAYYEDYHKTANEIDAIGKEITELYKNISTKPVADEVEHKAQNDANDAIRAEIQGLRVKIAKIQKDFTEKLAFSKDKTDSYIDDNGDIAYYNNTIGDHFMRMLDDYKKANGEQGLQSFYHYVESNLDIKTMKYDNKSFRRSSEESYINHLIANNFKGDILVPKYSSKLLIPKKGSYPSNKLAALSASERKAFDIVTKIYYESQMDLPEYSRPGTRVPSVPKEYMQKNLKDKMAIGKILKQEFTDHFSDEISENDSKKIPIYYVGNSMNANEISDNYFGTVLMFAKQAAAFRAKADTLHLAKEMQHTLGKSKQQDRTGEIMINKSLAAMGITEAIPAGTDWRQWFLEKWIDGVFFGKTNTPISWKVGKHNVRIDKILNKFMGFSAFGTIGGVKIVNFFTNLGMANTANLMNTTGYFEGAKTEQLYSWVQYMKAIYSGGKVMWDMLLDHVKQTEYSSSVYAELMDELEPLQGEYFDKFGNQLNRSFLGKAFSTTTWFAPSQFAEVQPQITAMIATLENIPVKLLDGSSTTLWKALTASNDLNANWQTIESSGDIVGWRNVREDVLINKKRKLEEVNRKLQGNYKSLGGINSPIMRQNVFGRMLENYKKWVVPGFLSRYKEDGYSINRNERDEGRYRVLFNYILSDAKWMWQSIGDKKVTPLDILWITPENIDRVRQYFTDEQIIAIRQAVIEQAFITFTSIMAVILLAIGKGSDDDDYMFSTAAAITLKISRDFNYFLPLNIDTPFTTEFFLNEKPDDMGLSVPLTSGMQDVMRIAKNPFAVMRTLDQIDALFEILTSNPSATYVRGKNKDRYKVEVAGLKLIGVTTGTDGKIFTDPLSR